MRKSSTAFATHITLLAFVLTMFSVGQISAQDEEEILVVTEVNIRGWTTADTRPGGTVDFVLDSTSAAPSGALKLTTDNSNNGATPATYTAKAQYMHSTETAIGTITDLSYSAKQINASYADGTASYQLVLCLGGWNPQMTNPCVGYTTMVFEPYQNGYPVAANAWETYDVDAGQMWSSRPFTNGTCEILAGGGGAPFYTLANLRTVCPLAVAIGFGVNIGSNNPNYDINVDLVRFNNTTYDFELYSTPATAEDCMKGGWSTFNPPSGPFKNQGQCVASTVPAT
jgi:hypothetical protein